MYYCSGWCIRVYTKSFTPCSYYRYVHGIFGSFISSYMIFDKYRLVNRSTPSKCALLDTTCTTEDLITNHFNVKVSVSSCKPIGLGTMSDLKPNQVFKHLYRFKTVENFNLNKNQIKNKFGKI